MTVQFASQVAIEEFSEVGKAVVGHVNSYPGEVVFDNEVLDCFPDGEFPDVGSPNTEVEGSVLVPAASCSSILGERGICLNPG